MSDILKKAERDVIGILTADVRLYYDMARFLRSRNRKFRLLDFRAPIPLDIGVILTSPEELDSIEFSPRVAVTDMETGLRQAIQALNGLEDSAVLVIGVDPGPEPGIAAALSDRIIETRHAQSPEHAADIIRGILSDYSYSQCVLRIGNGSPEHRNRILELVAGCFNYVEIVDETRTSKINRGYHAEAAVKIAGYGEDN